VAGTVKTYRVLKDGMKVGDSVRQYGDFIPEAADWPNLSAYLRANYVEVAYASEDEIATWQEEFNSRQSETDENDEEVEDEEVEDEEVEDEEVEDEEIVDESENEDDGENATAVPRVEGGQGSTPEPKAKKRVIRRKQNGGDEGKSGSADEGRTSREVRRVRESDEGRDDSGNSELAEQDI